MSDERFIRWQGNTLAQFSTALSLLSGLALAGLGFLFSLLRDPKFAPTGCYAALFLLALAGFFVAAAAGVLAVITRLLDFRLTARKVRNNPNEPLTIFGTDSSGYGKVTWRLFWVLLISFGVAVVCSVIVLSRVYLGSIVHTIV
jgi:hypothetical protein